MYFVASNSAIVTYGTTHTTNVGNEFTHIITNSIWMMLQGLLRHEYIFNEAIIELKDFIKID